MNTIKKLILCTVIISMYASLQAQDEIVIGKKDTLFSKALNETREIWISVPSDYREQYKGQKFPVILVLDGPDHFYSVVGMIDRFSSNIGNKVCPPMIVVGLKNTNRYRDFYPDFDANDKFSEFLEKELIPYIDNNYPTQPFRVIMGHSIAGLRVLKTAIYDRHLFNSYIAIDPSLGDKRNAWYDKARKDIQEYQINNNRIYVAMGLTMPTNDTTIIKKDTTSDSNHMRRIMEFSETMVSKSSNNKSFYWKYYPDETHQSLTQIATYDGLNFIFDWYKQKYLKEFFKETTSPERAIELYDNYFKTISENLGYEVKSPYDDSMVIWYLDYKRQYEKALAVARYNVQNHPDSEKPKEWIEKLEKKITDEKCRVGKGESHP